MYIGVFIGTKVGASLSVQQLQKYGLWDPGNVTDKGAASLSVRTDNETLMYLLGFGGLILDLSPLSAASIVVKSDSNVDLASLL